MDTHLRPKPPWDSRFVDARLIPCACKTAENMRRIGRDASQPGRASLRAAECVNDGHLGYGSEDIVASRTDQQFAQTLL
jgi:hypothetical protein